ncbi:Disease resistance protein RPM1-like protein [Drosera capensis]
MAETAVNFVLGKLMSLAWAEAEKLSGLGKEFNVIAKEIKSMQAFLMDAEGMAEDDSSANNWVTEVRSIAYRIEDAIDEYTMLQETKYQSSNFIQKAARSVHHMPALSRLARSIKDIKAEVVDVNRRKESYNFKKHLAEPGDSSSSGRGAAAAYPSQVSSLFAEDCDLVGINHRIADLIKLLDPHGEYSTCSVIAVVGMGGLGKTTLARRVYKDGAVGSNFPFRAWITVFQSYSPVTLLRDIMRQFHEAGKATVRINTRVEPHEEPQDTNDIPTLIDNLRNFLVDKRYLAVFDDVWNFELWDYIKSALPDQGNGSKILITTRDEAVAAAWKRSSYSCKNYVYKMQPLSSGEAWNLFCNMAFQGDYNKLCPTELRPLSLKMVSRCEGLPLAIVAIGSLLSTKQKTLLEWQRLHKNLGFHLQNNSQLKDIRRILFLSYHDLPYYLKPCFLYFGMFPEDYTISRGRLVRLWAAEGFLEKGRGKLTAEEVDEVADEYLSQLICRNLIQVSKWDFNRQRAKAFRVHDLLHELILQKLKELSFCQVSAGTCNVDIEFRRLSILSSTTGATFESSTRSKLSIRSIFLIGAQVKPAKLLQGSFLKGVHLLRVLMIEDAPVAHIPDEVGDLYHLRYLSIRYTEVQDLPNSIGKLVNLETLDLRHSPIFQLPMAIKKLHKLRHLSAYMQTDVFFLRGLQLSPGVLSNFKELEKLSCIDVSQPGVIHELVNLKHLRKLSITDLKTEDGFALCKALKNMDQLQRLFVNTTDEGDLFDLQHMASPPPLLRRLFLGGPLKRFPDWFANLSNVVELKLFLTGSDLVEDPLKILQTLPNLAHLGLLGGYIGLGLYVRSTGFQRLRSLFLWNFPEVSTIIIEKGGLPILEKLVLNEFPRLKRVPPGIRDLKNVTGLTLHIPEAIYDESDPIFKLISAVAIYDESDPIFKLISAVYFLYDWDAS